MIFFKLALKNALKHKLSSSIMLMIVSLIVFAMFWIFGFSNTFTETSLEKELFFNGHLSYNTDFVNAEEVIEEIRAIDPVNIDRIIGERRLMTIFSSEKCSGSFALTDINARNEEVVKKYRLDQGVFPQKDDELLLCTEDIGDKLKVGDSIYLTVFTYNKVVNTVKYKIVGTMKSGEMSLITKASMNSLVNSNDYCNTILLYTKQAPEKSQLSRLDAGITSVFAKRNVTIDRRTNFDERMKETGLLIKFFSALKVLVMAVLFPLVGVVLGAIVWVHSYKRRGELWTYSAMGFADRIILRIILLEYFLIAVCGCALGVAAGAASSALSEAANGMLSFSYIIEMLLVAKIGKPDLLLIAFFITANLMLWVRGPVFKILKSKPFSY